MIEILLGVGAVFLLAGFIVLFMIAEGGRRDQNRKG